MISRVFSGIQPTGNLTIGNYFGALVNFSRLQKERECFFGVVNLHALTIPQEPEVLREKTLEMARLFIATGVDPALAPVFLQSDIPEHSELSWLLECHTYYGELARMTQFKDKSQKREVVTAGLFSYPVLMAADIFLYQADLVPVGEDQKQHLELARDLARRVNNRYGGIFKIPEPYIPPAPEGGRIMSLVNPGEKMSKTDDNVQSYIALLDGPDKVRGKIKASVTDSGREVKYCPREKAGISNLLVIYALCSGKTISEVEIEYEGVGYGKFKENLAEVIIETLRPIQAKYSELSGRGVIEGILKEGRQKARPIAKRTLEKFQEKAGIKFS